MKYLLIRMAVDRFGPGESLDTNRIFLVGSSGRPYGPPRIFGELGAAKFEIESAQFQANISSFNVFFEVAQGEQLNALRLGYR